MNCTMSRKYLYLYVSKELSRKAAIEFERHVEQCPDCQREMAMYQQAIQGYQALPPVPPPEIRAETILKRAQQQAAPKRFTGYLPRVLIPVTAVFLVACVGLLALYMIHTHHVTKDEQSTAFVNIFDEPSLFEVTRSTQDVPQLDIRFPQEEPLTALAQDIAGLRRPVEDSLSFSSGHDCRVQYITQQIHALSTYQPFQEYLHADSILRRNIL